MNLLDPSALLEQLPRLLGNQVEEKTEGTEQAAQSQLRSPADALVALAHTILTKLSFRLISLSDSSSTDETLPSSNVLPPGRWNTAGGGTYTLHYTHDQSSLHFLLKTITLGPRIIFHATALESNRTESYEVELDRFTSTSFFPWPHQIKSSSTSTTTEPLVNGFVSSTRMADFVLGFQAKIIQKLVPGLRKEGYEEVPSNEEASSSSSSSARQPPQGSGQPRQPRPSYPDDDDYTNGPRGFLPPGRNPLIIGDRDLDPLGGGGGGLGGRGPFSPPPLFGGGGGGGLGGIGGDDGGGMIVGPNHPIFRDRFQDPNRGQQGGVGGLGGGMVPPGARFDPVGPFGQGPFGPGGIPGRGGGRGGGMGGRGRGNGEPDWDEMPPPGGVSKTLKKKPFRKKLVAHSFTSFTERLR